MARKKLKSSSAPLGLPPDYAALLDSLKRRVREAQTKAMFSVNRELIQLYWDLGQKIVERQEQEGWGKGVVDRLAGDLQKAFPGLGGFSASNVFRMRAFYLAYRTAEKVAQSVRQLKSARKVAQLVRQLPNVG